MFFLVGAGRSKSCTSGSPVLSLPSSLPPVFTFTAKVLGHSDISLDPPDEAGERKHTASGTGDEADAGTVVALSPSVAVVSVCMGHLQGRDAYLSLTFCRYLGYRL